MLSHNLWSIVIVQMTIDTAMGFYYNHNWFLSTYVNSFVIVCKNVVGDVEIPLAWFPTLHILA